MNPYHKKVTLINQLDNHISLQALEDYYTFNPKTYHLVSNVSFWHPTKNNKKVDNHDNEVVKHTSINNPFKVQKNWHLMPIMNNIHMDKNPRLVVQNGDLIMID